VGVLGLSSSAPLGRSPSRLLSLLLGSGDSIGDRGKWKDQLEWIVEQAASAEPLIPARRPVVLGVDSQRHTADLRRHRQGSDAGRDEEIVVLRKYPIMRIMRPKRDRILVMHLDLFFRESPRSTIMVPGPSTLSLHALCALLGRLAFEPIRSVCGIPSYCWAALVTTLVYEGITRRSSDQIRQPRR
jgi:hypothetical protein